jgi:hypothetical protein
LLAETEEKENKIIKEKVSKYSKDSLEDKDSLLDI